MTLFRTAFKTVAAAVILGFAGVGDGVGVPGLDGAGVPEAAGPPACGPVQAADTSNAASTMTALRWRRQKPVGRD